LNLLVGFQLFDDQLKKSSTVEGGISCLYIQLEAFSKLPTASKYAPNLGSAAAGTFGGAILEGYRIE
jgi:hypothetical protein